VPRAHRGSRDRWAMECAWVRRSRTTQGRQPANTTTMGAAKETSWCSLDRERRLRRTKTAQELRSKAYQSAGTTYRVGPPASKLERSRRQRSWAAPPAAVERRISPGDRSTPVVPGFAPSLGLPLAPLSAARSRTPSAMSGPAPSCSFPDAGNRRGQPDQRDADSETKFPQRRAH
jgi:hypothetical protein